jgi:hypothetical protein
MQVEEVPAQVKCIFGYKTFLLLSQMELLQRWESRERRMVAKRRWKAFMLRTSFEKCT